MRHTEGVLLGAQAVTRLPAYKTEAEDALNKTERVLSLALQGIRDAKEQMGKKQLEKVSA